MGNHGDVQTAKKISFAFQGNLIMFLDLLNLRLPGQRIIISPIHLTANQKVEFLFKKNLFRYNTQH